MNFFRRQLQYVSNSFFLDLGFQVKGVEYKEKKKSNRHPYSINKLPTKKNTKKKSLFLNTLRCNHLPTMTPKKSIVSLEHLHQTMQNMNK